MRYLILSEREAQGNSYSEQFAFLDALARAGVGSELGWLRAFSIDGGGALMAKTNERPIDLLSPDEEACYQMWLYVHRQKYPLREEIFERLTDREGRPFHSTTFRLLTQLLRNHGGHCVSVPDENGVRWLLWADRRDDGTIVRGMRPEMSTSGSN